MTDPVNHPPTALIGEVDANARHPTRPATVAMMSAPPLYASAAGMRGRPRAAFAIQGAYHPDGLWTIPRASGTCEGNWLALSAALRIGL